MFLKLFLLLFSAHHALFYMVVMSGYFAFPLQVMLWAQFRQAGTLWGTPVCEPVRATCEPLGGGVVTAFCGYKSRCHKRLWASPSFGLRPNWLKEGQLLCSPCSLPVPSRWFSGAVTYTFPHCPANTAVFIHAHGLSAGWFLEAIVTSALLAHSWGFPQYKP